MNAAQISDASTMNAFTLASLKILAQSQQNALVKTIDLRVAVQSASKAIHSRNASALSVTPTTSAPTRWPVSTNAASVHVQTYRTRRVPATLSATCRTTWHSVAVLRICQSATRWRTANELRHQCRRKNASSISTVPANWHVSITNAWSLVVSSNHARRRLVAASSTASQCEQWSANVRS